MLHVIEAATGRIVEVCAEGSDTSRFAGEDYLVIKDPAVHDPERERWDAETGKFTTIPEAELLARGKRERYGQLSAAFEAYLASRGYYLGWQNSADQAMKIAEKALERADASAEQRAAAQQILDCLWPLSRWIMGTVTGYFTQVGASIHAAQTLEELEAISWDFSQFDASDPGVSLGRDVFPILQQAQLPQLVAPEKTE